MLLSELTTYHLLFLVPFFVAMARILKPILDYLFMPIDHYFMRRSARRLGLVDRPGAPFE